MELTSLDLSYNEVGDKCARMLCNVLKHGQLSKLNNLSLRKCSLTEECILDVCETLCDEHCQLKTLVLTGNSIGDEGLHTLCTSALRNEKCMLTILDVSDCSLTDDCVQFLCETLEDVNCKVLKLYVAGNGFTEQSETTLRDVERSIRIFKIIYLTIVFRFENY
jgi:Ran GTPase-activating protein (RanGAP) involved in mRNA processing and transport